MESNKNNWALGEYVHVPRQTIQINKEYEYMVGSRYICIREATNEKPGILLKVLGKAAREDILIKDGKPFCKDDFHEGFYFDTYYSFRFPSVDEVKEVLDIIRDDLFLLEKFDSARMHVNPDSSFWVNDMANHLFFFKEPQYYDAQLNQLVASKTSGNDSHYRMTIAYFRKSRVFW